MIDLKVPLAQHQSICHLQVHGGASSLWPLTCGNFCRCYPTHPPILDPLSPWWAHLHESAPSELLLDWLEGQNPTEPWKGLTDLRMESSAHKQHTLTLQTCLETCHDMHQIWYSAVVLVLEQMGETWVFSFSDALKQLHDELLCIALCSCPGISAQIYDWLVGEHDPALLYASLQWEDGLPCKHHPASPDASLQRADWLPCKHHPVSPGTSIQLCN